MKFISEGDILCIGEEGGGVCFLNKSSRLRLADLDVGGDGGGGGSRYSDMRSFLIAGPLLEDISFSEVSGNLGEFMDGGYDGDTGDSMEMEDGRLLAGNLGLPLLGLMMTGD